MTILHDYIRNLHQTYDAQAIRTYPFPPALSIKLMQEQKWSAEYTDRVLDEYRRFIHLAATAGHEVTPSQIVDEAWHMHLTFSRDYWEKLVPLLPAPLHHEPGTGDSGDAAKYAGQYRQTLDDYRAAFRQEPPADIWPTPQSRRVRRGRKNVPTALLTALALGGGLAMAQVNLLLALVAGVVAYLLVNQFAGAWGTGGGGSCGGASCGYTGGDSCAVGGDSGDGGSGDGGCNDSGGSDGGGGDGGSCGGGCGGGCGS